MLEVHVLKSCKRPFLLIVELIESV